MINSHRILAKIWPLNHVPLSTSWVSTKGSKRGPKFVLMGPRAWRSSYKGIRVMEAVYTTLSMVWLIRLNQWTLASIRHDKWDTWRFEHVILPPWFNGLDCDREWDLFLLILTVFIFYSSHKISMIDAGHHDKYTAILFWAILLLIALARYKRLVELSYVV